MVLIATRGANSTIIGAMRSMKSAALAVAFGSEDDIGCDGDPGLCPVAGICANAGRSLSAPVAIRVANPSRTKSLRLMQPCCAPRATSERRSRVRSSHDFHCFELLEDVGVQLSSRMNSLYQLVSQVLPPSVENACSHFATTGAC